jgi:hypothetical protein
MTHGYIADRKPCDHTPTALPVYPAADGWRTTEGDRVRPGTHIYGCQADAITAYYHRLPAPRRIAVAR